MGEVWRAHDTETNRIVAIKVLSSDLGSDHAFAQRFRREAEMAAQLNNPHVIPIHGYGEIDGRLYVDMRLVEGRDLQQILATEALSVGRSVQIIEHVAMALDAAHRIGLVHRDVKPSNILVAEHDFAYLIDFGIARGPNQTALTSAGAVIGTWHYMAPERLSGREADGRADVYALACVLHECLTGSKPFPGDSLESQVAAHLTATPPAPSRLRPAVSSGFDTVIARGMAKNPNDRYSTAMQLAQAAKAAANPAPPQRAPTRASPHVPPPPPQPVFATPAPTRPRPPAATMRVRRRWPLIAASTAAVVAVLLVIIGWSTVRSNYYVATNDGTVSIMRGIQGSFLGIALQEPHTVGCLNDRNQLSLISAGDSADTSSCQLLKVDDLRPSERAQVTAGLPRGSLDDAVDQMNKLARDSVLPICEPASAPPTELPTSPSTVTALPPPPPEPGRNCRQVG
jgi:serine/threonine protein kinase